MGILRYGFVLDNYCSACGPLDTWLPFQLWWLSDTSFARDRLGNNRLSVLQREEHTDWKVMQG